MFFCVLCHNLVPPFRDFCAPCQNDLPWNQDHCPRCSEPQPTASTEPCSHCQADEPYYDQCKAPLLYEFPINQMILAGKQGNRPELFYVLARLTAEYFQSMLIDRPDALIPVPMYSAKQQKRGFNQSALIANILGRKLGIPVRYDLVLKTRDSAEQKLLSRATRAHNVARSFRVQRNALGSMQPTIRHIAIVDDVITTGSTLNQISKQLRSSGVERVDGWGLAKAKQKDNK